MLFRSWVNTTVKLYQNPDTSDIMSFTYTYNINEARIKEGIIEAVSAFEYDYISYIDLKANKRRLYRGCEDSIRTPSVQTDNYVDSMQQVYGSIVIPEDVKRAIKTGNIRFNA